MLCGHLVADGGEVGDGGGSPGGGGEEAAGDQPNQRASRRTVPHHVPVNTQNKCFRSY